MFDTDGSGAIGTDELGDAMKSMGMNATQRELEQLIREVRFRASKTHFLHPEQNTGWVKINRPPPIVLTNFVSDTLSIAYSDVLFGADSESVLIFYSRAKLEPVRELSP